ncbi:MAG: hypothetical protein JWM68_406 [Verrucomicrobiales bacterium]|nr:hypothetical protein [Verrucomicrobiales bacterium]
MVGVEYEYGITKYPAAASAQSGYIDTGIRLPLVDSRGTVILMVDNTYAVDLATELARLQQDLVGDRWAVIRHDVARTAGPPAIKTLIRNDYLNDPSQVRAVLLFGHVAVPYSGNYNADDHSEHTGAWVADTYYADVDNGWTDTTVKNTSAARLANRNIVGDGKFDQSVIPSDVEIEVGRVDFANLPMFLPRTEKDLLRDYLAKDHNFRHGIITAQRRGLIFDGFGQSGGQAYAASGWRNFAPFFGSAQITEVGTDQFFPTAATTDFLWAYVAGGGDANYMDCYGVGATSDFASNNVKTIFNMVFGSYWIDWDATNDFFRATLGSGNALTVAGAGRPHWFFHHMAMGETIGYSTRLSQNNAGVYVPAEFAREVHVSLLGDPTLRMHVVKPPSSLTATTNSGSVTLNWGASPDTSLQGYYVYRSNFFDGHFTAITNGAPVSGLSFTESVAAGTYTYMVRAIKLESSPSGTYSNASQGIFVTTTVSNSNSPIRLSQATLQSGLFSLKVNGQIGMKFVIERSTNLVQWTALLTNTLASTNFNFSDTPASSASQRFYRTQILP